MVFVGHTRVALGACLAFALVGPAVGDGADLTDGLLEATSDRCAIVLSEINTAENFDAALLRLATQICYVARLAEHVGRERSRLAKDGTDLGSVRSLEEAKDAKARAELLAFSQLDDQLQDASERRDELLEEMSEADPHEVNDLLRRLLGARRGIKG